MRNWMLVVVIGLAPFALVQALPNQYTLTAHVVRFSVEGREKASVAWCSNWNLGRIHQWRREMSPACRIFYDATVPTLRKAYFARWVGRIVRQLGRIGFGCSKNWADAEAIVSSPGMLRSYVLGRDSPGELSAA